MAQSITPNLLGADRRPWPGLSAGTIRKGDAR